VASLTGGKVELVDCLLSDGWKGWEGEGVAVIKTKNLTSRKFKLKYFPEGGVSYGKQS